VESIVFFACQRSGVMSRILPVLYAVTSCFAFSRPVEDVKSVLRGALSATCQKSSSRETETNGRGTHHTISVQGPVLCIAVSPRI
jgi:hypothetical protein